MRQMRALRLGSVWIKGSRRGIYAGFVWTNGSRVPSCADRLKTSVLGEVFSSLVLLRFYPSESASEQEGTLLPA